MAALLRRRLRPPVLGRLGWAWIGFAIAGGAFGAYAVLAGERTASPARIALSLGAEIDRFAPPETRSVMPRDLSRAPSAPVLRDGAADDAFAPETDDVFAGESLDALEQPPLLSAAEEAGGAIVITIDGSAQRRRDAIAASAAAYARPVLRIPNADPALLVKTALGHRPKVAADGRRAADLYARPFSNPDRKPIVGVIVAGLGLNAALTERAIEELPPEVTLAFAPYAKDLDVWTARAREAGHEIMIELPMEGHGGDPAALGPAGLLTARTSGENLQRLDWTLSRFDAYFGATNYLGGKFSADRSAMDPVLAHLSAAGLAYVDDTGAARRIGAGAHSLAVVNRMIAAATDGGFDGAKRDLKALESMAQRSGAALGKAYAYEEAIEALVAWTKELGEAEDKGVILAPASAIVIARSSDL